MFHTAAYSLAIPPGSDLDMPAVLDDILTITNNHFVMTANFQLVAAQVYSPLMDRAKISSPTMRQIAPPYLRPVEQKLVGSSNYNMVLWDNNPFNLVPYEEIQLLATSTIGAATEQATGLIWIQQTEMMIPSGGWIPLRFASVGTAVLGRWTTVPVIFADTIPSGVYAMVLSEVFSSNGQAHRWIVSNQNLRPGYPSFVNSFSRHPYAVSKGQFGMMGQFKSNDLPRLQVYCNGVDAVHTGYLHVVRIGSL